MFDVAGGILSAERRISHEHNVVLLAKLVEFGLSQPSRSQTIYRGVHTDEFRSEVLQVGSLQSSKAFEVDRY
jgi:hypothetical protein